MLVEQTTPEGVQVAQSLILWGCILAWWVVYFFGKVKPALDERYERKHKTQGNL